jgi:hypothetical protein
VSERADTWAIRIFSALLILASVAIIANGISKIDNGNRVSDPVQTCLDIASDRDFVGDAIGADRVSKMLTPGEQTEECYDLSEKYVPPNRR